MKDFLQSQEEAAAGEVKLSISVEVKVEISARYLAKFEELDIPYNPPRSRRAGIDR